MALRDDLNEIQKLVQILGKDLDALTLERLKKDAAFAKEYLESLNDEISEIAENTNNVSEGFRTIRSELSQGQTALKDFNSNMKSLQDLASKVQNIKEGTTKIDQEGINKLKDKIKQEKSSLTASIDTLKGRQRELQAKVKSGKITDKEFEQLKKINSSIIEGEALINNQSAAIQDLEANLHNVDEIEGDINKKLGAIPGLLAGMDVLFAKLGFKGGIFKKTLEETKAQIQESGDSTNVWSTYTSNLGKNFKALLSPANLLQGTILGLINGFLTADKATGELAKNMSITYSEANAMRQDFADIANSSMNANISVQGLQESQTAVSQALGSNAELNREDLETMTNIVKATGLQHQELMGIQKLSLVNGKSLEDNTKEALGGAKAYAMQNKLVLNEKQLLKEVNNASASLKLSLGGSTEALGEAVAKAKQFGINLEQAEDMASKLLDFESSIQSELEAELLTGKDLNLEKARELALAGKSADAAAEMLKQVGSAAEFGEMNVIAQESMAKAVGMTREQLANSLIEQEALAKLSEIEGNTMKEKYESMKAMGMSEAQIREKIGNDELARQLEQQSNQEKFNNAVVKLQEIFAQVADVLMPIFKILTDIVTTVLPAINFIVGRIVGFLKDWGKYILIAVGAFKTLKFLVDSNYRTTLLSNAAKKIGLITDKQAIAAQKAASVLSKGTELTERQKEIVKKRTLGTVIATNIRERAGLAISQARNVIEQAGTEIQKVRNVFEMAFNKIKKSTNIQEKASLAIQRIRNVLSKAFGKIQKSNMLLAAREKAAAIASAIPNIIKGAWASLGPIPFVGAGLAVAAIAGGIAYLMSKSRKGDDIMSPGQGSSGYGKRTLLGPEGAIQLNNKDTVIAGTNLFGNDVKSEAGKPTEMSGEGTIKVEAKKESGGAPKIDMSQTNSLLRELISVISAGGDVVMDGQKVGRALKLATRDVQ